MATTEVPDIVIGRLPIYLRALTLMDEAGQEFTSSQELHHRKQVGLIRYRNSRHTLLGHLSGQWLDPNQAIHKGVFGM